MIHNLTIICDNLLFFIIFFGVYMKHLVKMGIFISLIVLGLIKGSVFTNAATLDPAHNLSVDDAFYRSGSNPSAGASARNTLFRADSSNNAPVYVFYVLDRHYNNVSYPYDQFVVYLYSSFPNQKASYSINNGSTWVPVSVSETYGGLYYNRIPISFISTDKETNIPYFDFDLGSLSANFYSAMDDIILNGGVPGLTNEAVGYIRASYAANGSELMSNNASTFREYISWQPVSTTGYDLTRSGVTIQFAIRDNSYYSNSRISDPTNFYDWLYGRVSYLESYIYPSGSSRRSFMQGKSTLSPLNGQMRVVGRVAGSQLQFGFSPWNWYAGQQQDSVIKQFATDIQSGSSGGILQTLFPLHQSNADVCLSWDLYARIVPTSGTQGDWLKIDKHSVPVDQISDRLDGGITQSPVSIPSFPSTDPVDWFTAPADEPVIPDPDDTVNDDPLPVGLIDPQDGSPTYIYNNYTYNFDNRSWIENHYTNEYVDDTNEGLSWVKLFGGFFSLFLILFGAFLPEWAVAFVAVASPVVLGLAVFKMVKGIIPFA